MPQRANAEPADVLAIHGDRARPWVEEPQEQIDQGRLSGAGRTDDRHDFPWLRLERNRLQHRPVGLVTERHVRVAHVSQQTRLSRLGQVPHVGRGVEDLEHPMRVRGRILQGGGRVRDGIERSVERGEVRKEYQDGPDAHLAGEHVLSAEPHDGGRSDGGD